MLKDIHKIMHSASFMVASAAFGALSETEKSEVVNVTFLLKSSDQYIRYFIYYFTRLQGTC
jgi:uncharacterized protein YehS (DUF1456 family)